MIGDPTRCWTLFIVGRSLSCGGIFFFLSDAMRVCVSCEQGGRDWAPRRQRPALRRPVHTRQRVTRFGAWPLRLHAGRVCLLRRVRGRGIGRRHAVALRGHESPHRSVWPTPPDKMSTRRYANPPRAAGSAYAAFVSLLSDAAHLARRARPGYGPDRAPVSSRAVAAARARDGGEVARAG